MGLLDQLAGKTLGKFGAQQQDAAVQSSLMDSVMKLIDSSGGLPALLRKLNESGLEQQVSSWIAEGENLPVSADQIRKALGDDSIQQVAQESGVEPEQAASGLAQLLPQLVHQLTPYGQMPQGDMLSRALHKLKEKLFG